MTARFDRHAAQVVRVARRWVGTPFVEGQSLEGAGCDCAGLIRGLWRETVGAEPEAVPPYAQDEPARRREETLLDMTRRHMTEVDLEYALPGDLILYRLRDGGWAQHAAILVEGSATRGRIVHAMSGHGVRETPAYRITDHPIGGVFRFPLEAAGEGEGDAGDGGEGEGGGGEGGDGGGGIDIEIDVGIGGGL